MTSAGDRSLLDAMPLSIAFAIIIIGPWLFGRASRAARLPAILGMLVFGISYAALVLIRTLGPKLLSTRGTYA